MKRRRKISAEVQRNCEDLKSVFEKSSKLIENETRKEHYIVKSNLLSKRKTVDTCGLRDVSVVPPKYRGKRKKMS